MDFLRNIRKRPERRNVRSGEITLSNEKFVNISERANKDRLTGLINRSTFLDIAQKEFETMVREGYAFSLAIMDIDHFKRINDTYGHGAGDQALSVVGLALGEKERRSDLIARYGGEEFIALMPDAEAIEAAQVVERIRKRVAEMEIDVNQEKKEAVTMSAGVTQYRIGDTLQSMIDRADGALFESKATGRDKLTVIVE